jgi:hypothetical protein
MAIRAWLITTPAAGGRNAMMMVGFTKPMEVHAGLLNRLEYADIQTPTFFSLWIHVDSYSSQPLIILALKVRPATTEWTKLLCI